MLIIFLLPLKFLHKSWQTDPSQLADTWKICSVKILKNYNELEIALKIICEALL